MRIRTIGIWIPVLHIFSVYGQAPAQQNTVNVDRVFSFTHAGAVQEFLEITTAIRTIEEIRDATPDNERRSLAVRGTALQVRLAEWLSNEMERQPPLQKSQHLAAPEYQVSESADDVARVFYLTHAETVQDCQEIATAIRTVANILRVFTVNPQRALLLRGTHDQLTLAERLFEQLDKPIVDAAAYEYRMPGTNDDVVKILYVTHAGMVRDFQEIATLTRTITNIRQIFTYNAQRAVVARGTSVQLALAEWLIRQVDLPTSAPASVEQSQTITTQEYPVPGSSDDVVRVFFLSRAATVEGFQQIAVLVRDATKIRQVFTYNAPRVLAVRGTTDQTMTAERLLKVIP